MKLPHAAIESGDSAYLCSKAGTAGQRRANRDAGLLLIEEKGRPSIWKHFWQSEYNRPLIDFFKNPEGKATEELKK